MAIVRWDPFREMEDLFERYTKAVGHPQRGSQELTSAGDWSPRVDIAETDTEYIIKAEIPDVKKEDVKVTVDSSVLKISGERKQEKEEKDKKYHKIERYYGKFARSFTLPEDVEIMKIEAIFKDGMLNLHIPKVKEAKSKKIEVKVT